jgi:hypothetical protein
MLEEVILTLKIVRSKLNKSEVSSVNQIDQIIKQLEEMSESTYVRKDTKLRLLDLLHDALVHLPSILAIIKMFHDS